MRFNLRWEIRDTRHEVVSMTDAFYIIRGLFLDTLVSIADATPIILGLLVDSSTYLLRVVRLIRGVLGAEAHF